MLQAKIIKIGQCFTEMFIKVAWFLGQGVLYGNKIEKKTDTKWQQLSCQVIGFVVICCSSLRCKKLNKRSKMSKIS